MEKTTINQKKFNDYLQVIDSENSEDDGNILKLNNMLKFVSKLQYKNIQKTLCYVSNVCQDDNCSNFIRKHDLGIDIKKYPNVDLCIKNDNSSSMGKKSENDIEFKKEYYSYLSDVYYKYYLTLIK